MSDFAAPAAPGTVDGVPLTIEARFNGPDDSANGGYACGLFAGVCPEPVAVTLHAPPRLEVPLRAEVGARRAHLWDGDDLVATAAPTRHRVVPPAPVPFAAARAAVAHYRGRRGHPYPHCFACGPGRAPGDGLRLAPGPVPDRTGTVACPWVPDAGLLAADGRVRAEFVWAALDCPSGWTADLVAAPKVLGWMRAELTRRPLAGEPCVVVATLGSLDSAGLAASSALYDDAGLLLAAATTRWYAPSAG
ncbi:hypothetical protein AMES_6149 [Amycolatopsis mediterranei S699]|uniref:Uncharacterized protein n=2 Tax=Amycolatopsis mediterranei TaxID=33910 RepID=A0A0H3DEB4_AMYMU|nr:hypothetical protein [Amycolatopsis mediterranei]ADJ47974.1 conserved hypothetical protein [Amycolatopsis mediterranei U32]AEK44874.1 hypothetical protein RAM_32005 [Amycolatopsis mediterranei S699]AFO79685.1 hypothetical protein AMES_6149 [Amycolatopsis mediterranei S699]AGT86813.1 hypothetical protein B737_6149 [Amycolatopsis mediterranei RB]KDO10460.1 hypothetical protein DV26_11260 [Amycolatopsis mediterranei]